MVCKLEGRSLVRTWLGDINGTPVGGLLQFVAAYQPLRSQYSPVNLCLDFNMVFSNFISKLFAKVSNNCKPIFVNNFDS